MYIYCGVISNGLIRLGCAAQKKTPILSPQSTGTRVHIRT